MVARRVTGDFESLPFFRRALELDADFAVAHARLGTVLGNLGQAEASVKAITRAFELRDKVSERERWYIEARYYTTVVRDLPKAIESYRLFLATYPTDSGAHTNLGTLYRARGMVKEATASLEESVRLAPDQPLGHLNLGYAYLDEARFADARRAFEQTVTLQDSTTARTGLFIVGTLTGDRALIAQQLEALRGRRDEIDTFQTRVQAAGYLGQMAEAKRLTDEWFQRLTNANRLSSAGEGLISLAMVQAMTGRLDFARSEVARARQHGIVGPRAAGAAVALGVLLDDRTLVKAHLAPAIEQARRVSAADEADKNERAVRAMAAMAEGRDQEAFELAASVGVDPSQRTATFFAGLAALRVKRFDEAARAFGTLAGLGSRLGVSPLTPTVQVMLGRALAGAGRAAEARAAYQEAFRIWNDADADLPLLLEARQEYGRLGQ